MIIFHKNIESLTRFNEALKQKEKFENEIPMELKEYESFKGRVDFTDFVELFNFEDKIYKDKQFKYSLISNNNKRLIPEFISAACSKLIYDGLIDIEIRTKLEQYFIAILSNLDYRNYATFEQLKDELNSNNAKNNFYYILGSCPLSFKDHKFPILKERIDVSTKFFEIIYDSNPPARAEMTIYLREEKEKTDYDKQIKPFINIKFLKIKTNEDNNIPKSKLTKEELSLIFKEIKDNPRIKDNPSDNYNLVLFASTYHISKVAQEIEKYFYDKASVPYPKNIFIIGTEKFFDLITNRKITAIKKEADEMLVLKKMQSFLFEIFMHSLDRNRQ